MSDYVPLLAALEGHFEQSLDELPDALRSRVENSLNPLKWDDCDPDHRRRLAKQFDTPPTPSISEEKRQAIGEAIARELALTMRHDKWKTVSTPTSSDLKLQETTVEMLSREIATLKESRHIERGDYYPDPPNVKTKEGLNNSLHVVASEACQPKESAESTNAVSPRLSGLRDEGINQHPPVENENQGVFGDPCAAFRDMKNLTAEELSISFVGDKNESGMGANNMLEISARNVKKRVALAAIDLVDLRKGQLNSQGAILLGITQKRNTKRTDRTAQVMTRLRKVFRNHLGIRNDSFERYRETAGWVPLFSIDDKRGAADERAKQEAERRTVSYEQLMESGEKARDTSQTHQPHGSEFDAEEWMQKNNFKWDMDTDPDVLA